MGDRSGIEWTDATWNILLGCSKCSPGCDHCYAIETVERVGRMGQTTHQGLTVVAEAGRDWTGEVRMLDDRKLTQPLRWRRPRRIFTNSLSDLFHSEVARDDIARIFAVMSLADWHTFQVLTKRPIRARVLLGDHEFRAEVDEHREQIRPGCGDFAWPLPNLWLGVSIESAQYSWRATALRATPAAVRWVSAEPLLGPLDNLDLTGIDWVVAGGESGPRARAVHPAWITDLLGRCWMTCNICGAGIGHGADENDHRHTDTIADHVARRPAFHFKQWGEFVPMDPQDPRACWVVELDGRRHARFGEDLEPIAERGAVTVAHLGKRSAGRELNGRTWDEWPATVPAPDLGAML